MTAASLRSAPRRSLVHRDRRLRRDRRRLRRTSLPRRSSRALRRPSACAALAEPGARATRRRSPARRSTRNARPAAGSTRSCATPPTTRARASRCSGVNRGTEGFQTCAEVGLDAPGRDPRPAVRRRARGRARRRARDRRPRRATPGRVGEAAIPLFFGTTRRTQREVVGSVVVFSRAAARRRRRASTSSATGSWSPAASRCCSRRSPGWLVARRAARAGQAAGAGRGRARRRRRLHRALPGRLAATSSASSPARWTTCGASSPSSTRRASASSRPRRTSCARRSSRSAASSSCSRTRTSPRRTGARFLAQLREQVDRLGKLATDLLDLSKLEAGSLELRPERDRPRRASRAAVAGEFEPALAAHDSHLELRLPARAADGRVRS